MELSETHIERYARHILLPELGGRGQRKLLRARVLMVGAGGLGCAAAPYLAAAGVGTVGLIDHDVVELSNLQRQVLYATAQIGQYKAPLAASRLQALNPDTTVIPYPHRLTADNARSLFCEYDLIVDGSDNFPTRYLVNDACVALGKPNAFGSVLGFEGQASLFVPGGPCYRCAFPSPPPEGSVPTCAQAGVIGTIAGLIGMIQANEALKWLLQAGQTLAGRLLLVDALAMRFDEVQVERSADCPACRKAPTSMKNT